MPGFICVEVCEVGVPNIIYGVDVIDLVCLMVWLLQCFYLLCLLENSLRLCDCSVCQRLHGAPMQWAALFPQANAACRLVLVWASAKVGLTKTWNHFYPEDENTGLSETSSSSGPQDTCWK